MFMFIASKFCKISFTLDKLIEGANVDDAFMNVENIHS
jgi:hypothetical protein